MHKMIQKAKKNQKGFTLVELMVVVVIIGILVAIAVPLYRNVTESANRRAVEANLRTIDGSISMYLAEEGDDPSETTLISEDYMQSWPAGPDGVTYSVDGSGADARAQADGTNAGDWFTGTTQTLPIDWD